MPLLRRYLRDSSPTRKFTHYTVISFNVTAHIKIKILIATNPPRKNKILACNKFNVHL